MKKGIAVQKEEVIKKSNIGVDGYIPKKYAPEDYEKIHLYQRIDKATKESELNKLEEEIKDRYGDERRTHIDMTAIDFIEDESLIPVEDIIINLTNKGYIKRLPIDTYKVQKKVTFF